eukprot:1149519-Pelagomonas_calceolata.AAC.2
MSQCKEGNSVQVCYYLVLANFGQHPGRNVPEPSKPPNTPVSLIERALAHRPHEGCEEAASKGCAGAAKRKCFSWYGTPK